MASPKRTLSARSFYVKHTCLAPGAAPSTNTTLTHVREGSAETDGSGTVAKNQNAELLVAHWRHYSLEHQPVEVPPRAKLSINAATMCAPRWLRGGYNVCPVTRERNRFWQSAGCVRSALPPVASGCASTGVYICNTQDCIAVPRHLYELRPATAPQVAGATQMSTRPPGCRFYFPENPKWRHVLKRKKWKGREKSIFSNEIGFKWIFHVFTWKSNHKGGSLHICWTYYNDSNTLIPVFLTELRMGWLLIFHYNGNLTTFTFECDGVLLTSPNLQPTTWHRSHSWLLYLCFFYLFIYILVVLYWIKISS